MFMEDGWKMRIAKWVRCKYMREKDMCRDKIMKNEGENGRRLMKVMDNGIGNRENRVGQRENEGGKRISSSFLFVSGGGPSDCCNLSLSLAAHL